MRFILFAILIAAPNVATADDEASTNTVRKAIPDRLVVLTFDDSARSHYTVVRPLLKQYEFGATFFITEGFDFKVNKKDYTAHDWVSSHQQNFEAYMKYLSLEGYRVIALRDLHEYVDPNTIPADINTVIDARRKSVDAESYR